MSDTSSTVPPPPAAPPAEINLPPTDTVRVPAIAEYIDLPSGKELNEALATKLAASRPVRLVVFAGEVSCGKTTLLTSLYELFQWRQVPEYCFAGSCTLPAFEQRCYLGRMSSENAAPDTQRTLYRGPDPYYLHLKIAPASAPQKSFDFLFTDVSGEMFEHARNSIDECKELTFLRRATDFLLLLDGEKCARTDERHAVVGKSKALLQSCLDSNMLSRDCVVNVVWTKFDYFDVARSNETHSEFRHEVERDFRASFESRVARLDFSKIAARPTNHPALGFGHGVPELLKGWMTCCPRFEKIDLLANLKLPSGSRESELFAFRHFASMDPS